MEGVEILREPGGMAHDLDPVLAVMPVSTLRVALQWSRTPVLAPRQGADLLTSLRGLFMRELVTASCARDGACQSGGTAQCEMPHFCAMPVFWRPRSAAQRRDHVAPVQLGLADGDERRLLLDVSLWGARAVTHQATVLRALRSAGRKGVIDSHGRVCWQLHLLESEVLATGEVATAESAPSEAILGLETPTRGSGGMAEWIGQLAHDLTQWALADAGEAETLGKAGCDARSDAMRERARAALDRADHEWLDAAYVQRGLRRSGSNGGMLAMSGVVGVMRLKGDLRGAWPWVRLATMRGLGGRKSFGMGQLRLLTVDMKGADALQAAAPMGECVGGIAP